MVSSDNLDDILVQPKLTTVPNKLNPKKTKSKRSSSGSKKKNTRTVTLKGFPRRFATHNYHDYANMALPHSSPDSELKGQTTRSSTSHHIPFPLKLFHMLQDAHEKKFDHIVSWQPHGRSFRIHSPDLMVRDILPKYFNHSKIRSFQRQLALYNFCRLNREGPDRGAYYHEAFLRGRAFLCSRITRTRVKGTFVRVSSSPESEPDFYAMDPVRPMAMVMMARSDTGLAQPSVVGQRPPKAPSTTPTTSSPDKILSVSSSSANGDHLDPLAVFQSPAISNNFKSWGTSSSMPAVVADHSSMIHVLPRPELLMATKNYHLNHHQTTTTTSLLSDHIYQALRETQDLLLLDQNDANNVDDALVNLAAVAAPSLTDVLSEQDMESLFD